MFKLSLMKSVFCTAKLHLLMRKTKINNCIANSKSIIGNNKTSTKGKRNFHISYKKLMVNESIRR